MPLIKSFDKSESGYLLIGISSSVKAEKWRVSVDGGKKTELSGANPKLKLLEGLHSYKLESEGFPDIDLKINFVPSRVYKKAGNSNSDVVDIVKSSAPIGAFERYPVDFFAFDSQCHPADATISFSFARRGQIILL